MELHYFLHGLIILMIGLLAGFPFAKAIKLKNGREVAWRVVHSGSSVAGIMLIAIGALVKGLALPYSWDVAIFSGTVLSTYIFVLGMLLAAMYGERGMGNGEEKETLVWKTVKTSYAIGALLSIVSIVALILSCFAKIYIG